MKKKLLRFSLLAEIALLSDIFRLSSYVFDVDKFISFYRDALSELLLSNLLGTCIEIDYVELLYEIIQIDKVLEEENIGIINIDFITDILNNALEEHSQCIYVAIEDNENLSGIRYPFRFGNLSIRVNKYYDGIEVEFYTDKLSYLEKVEMVLNLHLEYVHHIENFLEIELSPETIEALAVINVVKRDE